MTPLEEPQNLLRGNLELAEKGLAKEETEQAEEELSVDEVIEKHVGSLGLSQMLHVLLVSLAWIFDSQHTLVTIFSDAQPPGWRCTSDLCKSSDDKNGGGSVCGMVPGTWEWVGGNKTSIVAEWGLVCEHKFLAAVPASLFFIGSLLGSSVFGVLADGLIGRKKAVLLSCILTSATAFLTALSPNIWIYALLRAANGFARSGIGICCIVLSTEVVGRKWRGQVGQYGFFFFTAGFLSLPLIAYPTRNNWRNLYKILSLMPLAYLVLLLPFVYESPRWLLVRGRSNEAISVLQKLARLNGKKLPTNLILSNPSEGQTTATEESLWRTKWAAKRMVLLMVAGFGIGFVYYGVQLNVGNLNFNLYFSTGLNALMEIPAVVIGSILLSIMNRRLLFSMSAYVAGASSILCIIFTHGRGKGKGSTGSWPQLIIEGIGFMAASIAYDVLYIYCVELFPTNVRNFAVSQMRQTLMLGASIAPLLVVVGHVSPSLSFIIFGVLSIISGIISWWLPETRNAPLYQTLKQQAAEEKQISEPNNSTQELASN